MHVYVHLFLDTSSNYLMMLNIRSVYFYLIGIVK